jgi:hypothetical protein
MLRIRVARPYDAAATMRVRREAVLSKAGSHYPQATLEAWSPGATPNRVAHVEKEIADPAFIVLVAEAGEEITGFAMAIPSKNELRAVYVKPNSIGNVGRALLTEVEKRAFTVAEFLICDASLNAERFYKANGYTEELRADHVLSSGPTIPCVRMKKIRPRISDFA